MEQTDHELRELIIESAKGDTESCKKLYESLADRVFAYVRFRTSTKEQALDLTQDIFIDLFATLSHFTYQSRAQFYSYVFVIARRKLARHYADSERRGTRVMGEFDEETMSPTQVGTPTETESDVARALATLDDATREIVVLHHWSRYTFGEIGTLLNMTESAVRVRHHRALTRLRDAFQGNHL